MPENGILASSYPATNRAWRFFAQVRRAFADRRGAYAARVSAIVLAALLAAAVAQAQDSSTAGMEAGQTRGANNTVQIPTNAPDSSGSGESDAYSDDAQSQQQTRGQGFSETEDGAKFSDLDQFTTSDDVYESPIGALLQHDCAELAHRQDVCGLAVLRVRPGSAAAVAGIRSYSGLGHTLLGATVVGAAMVFPPAFAALGLVEQSHIGESFDLIVGVDGQRIHSIPDFQGAIAEVRIGDVLYLTVVRDGKRLQIPLRVTQ